jgi:hypothetical protein
MNDVLASWSAALAVWGGGAALICLYRAWSMWGALDCRRIVLLVGAFGVCAGIGIHQGFAWWSWELGRWPWTTAGAPTIVYRVSLSCGLLAMAGAISWERCRHRGWLALLAVGAAMWAVAWAI